MNGEARLFIHGVTAEEWTARWGVEPFRTPCRCGASLTTSIPFIQGTLRGLQSPPCVNGCHDSYTKWMKAGRSNRHKGVINWPPYALVRDRAFGDLFSGREMD